MILSQQTDYSPKTWEMFDRLGQCYKWVLLIGRPEDKERLLWKVLFNDLKIYALIMQVYGAVTWKTFVSWQPIRGLPLQNNVNATVFSETQLAWHMVSVF